MKNSLSRKLALSTTAFALVATATPAVALAQSTDVSVSANVSGTVTAPATNGPMRGARMGADASSSMRMRANGTGDAGMRMGSSTNMASVISKATDEINKRIQSLNDLAVKIDSMKLLSDSDRTTLKGTVSTEVSTLQSLSAKIAADTDQATLKADVQSIAKSYRVYLLVIPQQRITSAADRVIAIGTQMQALSAKLATRISASASVPSTVTAAKADFDAKVADSQTQAKAAVALIAGLAPDNGDATVKAANTAALKSAVADIQKAQQDLKAARTDASTIVQGIKGLGVGAATSAAVHASSSASNS